MERIKLIVRLALLLLAALPMLSAAQDKAEESPYFTAQGLNFMAKNDGATCVLVGAEEQIDGELVIPEHVQRDGKTFRVSDIMGYAFINEHKLLSVTIPVSVKTISVMAFAGCSALEKLNLPDNDSLSVASSAFAGCDKLRGKIKYPVPGYFRTQLFDCLVGDDGKTCSVREAKDTYIETALMVPESLTDDGGRTYTVTAILPSGFVDHDQLSYVTLPSTLKEVGAYAFYNCPALKSLVVPQSVEVLGRQAFSSCDQLVAVSLPEGLKEIGEACFYGCQALRGIVLPKSLTSMGAYAFGGCQSLESIDIPAGVTVVETGAFAECTGLKKIVLPSTLTNINDGAFYGCRGVTDFWIPNQNTKLGTDAFTGVGWNNDVNGITRVTLTKGSSIEGWFNGSNKRLTTVRLGALCEGLDSRSLRSVPQVTTLEVDLANPLFKAVAGVLYSKDGTQLVALPPAFQGSFTVPEGVKTTATGAFGGCANLTAVVLPASLTSLGFMTFDECPRLTSLTMHATTALPQRYLDFNNCPELKSVVVVGPAGTDLQPYREFFGEKVKLSLSVR